MKFKNRIKLLTKILFFIILSIFFQCNIFAKLERGTNPILKLLSQLFADKTQIAVTSILPKDKSTSNYVNTGIYIVFNKTITDLSSITFTISSDGGNTNHPGTTSLSDTVISFTPTTNFADNTTYTITVSGGGLAETFFSTFSTSALVDNTPPTVSSTNPATGDIDIPINTAAITATLSETIAPNSLTTTSITITGGITGTITLNDQTLTFQPSGNLTANTIYAVTVKAGLKDLAGNALAANYSWTFTSGSTVTLGTSCTYDTSLFDTCFFE